MESPRLRLRRFNFSDLKNVQELESDPEVMKFTAMRRPLSTEQTQARLQSWIDKESEPAPLGVWAAELKESSDFVGWFMLLKTKTETPELGFMLVQRHWGKGYATEACRVLLEHAFNKWQVKEIRATTDPANESSKNILRKLGFSWARHENQLDIFELRR